MDAARFDALARALGAPASRRGLLGAALGGFLGGVGLGALDAKKKRKGKKKKKRAADGCAACGDDECCDGGACRTGFTDSLCGKFGEPCEDCAAQGLKCNGNLGVCTCNAAVCASQGKCCDTGQCVDGSTVDNCGDDGAPCEFCVSQFDERCSATEENRLGCCAPVGKLCGLQPIIVGNVVVGSKRVKCCAGSTCDFDQGTCVARPSCLEECSSDKFCCGQASGGRTNICLYKTGLSCPLGETNPLGGRFVGANCPETDGICCVRGEASTCPQTAGECPPDETEAQPITCLDESAAP